MKHALCVAVLLSVGLLLGCSSGVRRTVNRAKCMAEAATDQAAQAAAERDQPAVEFVSSLTTEQVALANETEGGLAWTGLTQAQQTMLRRLWESNHDLLTTAGKVPEEAKRILNPGPIETAKVVRVGYALVPEETKSASGGYRFECRRYPVSTAFEGTVLKPKALTAALSAHGINFSETGEVRQWLNPPAEATRDLEAAEERAKAQGGSATLEHK
jgi:hypothetical protein